MARQRVVIAHAVDESGRRDIIGLNVGGEAETEAIWRDFLRSLVRRVVGCSWPSATPIRA